MRAWASAGGVAADGADGTGSAELGREGVEGLVRFGFVALARRVEAELAAGAEEGAAWSRMSIGPRTSSQSRAGTHCSPIARRTAGVSCTSTS